MSMPTWTLSIRVSLSQPADPGSVDWSEATALRADGLAARARLTPCPILMALRPPIWAESVRDIQPRDVRVDGGLSAKRNAAQH